MTIGPPSGRVWKIFLGLGAISIVAYFLSGEPQVQMVLYDVTGLVVFGAMLIGIRRNRPASRRPWILLALGILAWTVGDAIWSGYEIVLHEVAPWPSTADYVYLAGPVLMALGLTGMLRRRGSPRDVEGVLDALMIAAGAGALSWAFFMAPFAADASLEWFPKSVAVAYPLADVLLLVVVVRLLLAPGSHAASHRLLAIGVACTLVADVIYSVQSLNGTYHTGHPVDAGWLAFYWFLGAAALHPSMSSIAGTTERGTETQSRSRIVALALAASLAPVTLIVQWLRDAPLDIPVIAGASIFIFLLVLLRMERLVHAVQGKVAELRVKGEELQRSLEQREELTGMLRYQALHDPLTGLANRSLFNDRLEHAIHRIARTHEAVGVLFFDIDDFKVINDTLGHSVGDQILSALGERLQGLLRISDLAARMGGDEFAILLEGARAATDPTLVAERILTALDAPFMIGGRSVTVRGSIGVAVTDDAATMAQDLLRQSDIAMYAAKTEGKHRFMRYEPKMQDLLIGELRLLAQLQGGVGRGEFRAYFQPIVDLPNGEIRGAEALIRWQHPDRGLIPPAVFLPLAERAGTIFELDVWMLQEACRELAGWRQLAPERRLQVAVNLSAESLQNDGILGAVATAISASGVEPSDVVIEVTESALVRDIDATVRRLQELKGLGVEIAIDDFGIGYSSLDHLRRFPVDILKIDKSFVDCVARGPEEASFAGAIISLAEQLHLWTVAEGIETQEQARTLVGLGARSAQGYLYSRPVPADEMGALLMRSSLGVDRPLSVLARAPGLAVSA